jgi:hypothetical protein
LAYQEVDVRELMLGIVVVGLVVGAVVGRHIERARRGFRDWGVAKTATTKAKTTFFNDLKRAVLTVSLVVSVVVGLMILAYSRSDS